MYQSGWAGEVTLKGSNGPYCQTGLIWAMPPRRASTAVVNSSSDTDLKVCSGQPLADHVALGLAGAGELGVLLQHQDGQVDPDQGQQQGREQHHVEHEQPRDDVRGRELAPEQEIGDPGADHRDGQGDGVEDAQADAVQQVVGERVAGEALAQGQEQQADADQPVDLAGGGRR